MTRRDYVELAEVLKAVKPPNTPDTPMGYIGQHAIDCEAIADYCASRDPKFNKERFLKNAGVPT